MIRCLCYVFIFYKCISIIVGIETERKDIETQKQTTTKTLSDNENQYIGSIESPFKIYFR